MNAALPSSLGSGLSSGDFGTNTAVRPFGGHLGSGYSAGAGALGSGRLPGALSSPAVAFDATGKPYLDAPDWKSSGLDDFGDPGGFSSEDVLDDGGPVISSAGLDGLSGELGTGADFGSALGEGGGGSVPAGLGGGGGIPGGLGGGGSATGALGVGGLTAGATLAATGSAPVGATGVTAATASGLGGGSAISSRGGMGGGMPMMPMGGAGGGQGGQGNRPPAWLVEVDDVWGEDAVVTAPVIGAGPPPPSGRG